MSGPILTTQNSNRGGELSAPNRAPAAKVIAGALANTRVAQALINALGARSANIIIASSTSQTINFGSLKVGDYVVHIPLSGAPSPLGNAAGYGILASSTITNTGSSVITGNLGLYPGSSVTGFPPGTVTGVENIDNAAANSAMMDATSYFNVQSANAIASGVAISATLDGQTLTPGVYKTGAASLAGSGAAALTFNGAGTYIIYTSSTLVTGSGGTPTMTLSGGASAANIYWLVGSSATINSGHAGTFQGNVIAEVSITDTSGGTVDGGLIALTGAVTLSAASNVNAESSAGASASFSTIAVAGNLGAAAVVGDMYIDLSVIDLDSNNPKVPPPPAQLTGRRTGDGGLEF